MNANWTGEIDATQWSYGILPSRLARCRFYWYLFGAHVLSFLQISCNAREYSSLMLWFQTSPTGDFARIHRQFTIEQAKNQLWHAIFWFDPITNLNFIFMKCEKRALTPSIKRQNKYCACVFSYYDHWNAQQMTEKEQKKKKKKIQTKQNQTKQD